MSNRNPPSKSRLLAHGLIELPNDINGQPDGQAFHTFLDFTEMRSHKSVAFGINGVWSGRLHKFPSMEEADVFVVLEGVATVLSIREGYFVATNEVMQRIANCEEVYRNQVMTIDFVLTRPPLNPFGSLRYQGLSFKPDRLADTERERRRAKREEAALAPLGWSWSYVKKPSKVAVDNHKKLRNWAKAYCLDDAERESAQLAALFYRSTSTKSLRSQLAMFCKRLGISERDQFFVFATAYYFGYLALDHTVALGEDLVPTLKRPARTTYQWSR